MGSSRASNLSTSRTPLSPAAAALLKRGFVEPEHEPCSAVRLTSLESTPCWQVTNGHRSPCRPRRGVGRPRAGWTSSEEGLLNRRQVRLPALYERFLRAPQPPPRPAQTTMILHAHADHSHANSPPHPPSLLLRCFRRVLSGSFSARELANGAAKRPGGSGLACLGRPSDSPPSRTRRGGVGER